MDNLLLIAISEIKIQIDNNDGLESRVRSAMQYAKNYWLFTDDDKRFRAAVGAVMLTYEEGSEERDVLLQEIKVLKSFASSIETGNIFNTNVLDEDILKKSVGLLKIWNEIKSSD